MAAPGTNPSWATDTNLASGPDAGLPTKESPDPSSGVIAQGFIPGVPFFAPRLNWILNLYGKWLAYLGEVIANRVLHIPITRAYQSSVVANPGEPAWYSDVASGSAYLRTTTSGNKATLLVPISDMLPDGAVISRIRVAVTTGAARTGGNAMRIAAYYYTLNGTTLIPGALTLAGPAGLQANAASNQVLDTFISYTVDRSTLTGLLLMIEAGHDAATNADTVYSVVVTYTGPPALR